MKLKVITLSFDVATRKALARARKALSELAGAYIQAADGPAQAPLAVALLPVVLITTTSH